MKKYNWQKSKIKTTALLPAIYLAIVSCSLFNPFEVGTKINKFDRKMGNALLNGVDISQIIRNIYLLVCILIPLLTIVIYLLLKRTYSRSKEYNIGESISFINELSLIGFGILILSYLSRFTDQFSFRLDVAIPTLLILLVIIYIWIRPKLKDLRFEVLQGCMLGAVPLVYIAIVIVNRVGITISPERVSLFYVGFVIICFIVLSLFKTKINFDLLEKAYLIMMTSPIIAILTIEIINILNQYNVKVVSKYKMVVVLYLILFLVTASIYIKGTKKSLKIKKDVKGIYYILILITLGLIWTQMPYQNIVATDFFEQSNHGSSIYNFLSNFQLPIIENFDAHMLSNSLPNIVYGLVNQDKIGAIFSGYSLQPLYLVLFYCLFKKIFEKNKAFLIMLFFPILVDYTYTIFAMGIIVILITLHALEKKKYYGYWNTLVLICLFRIDLGFSFGISSVITLVVLHFLCLKKDQLKLKKFVTSFLVTSVIWMVSFSVLCINKGINPINRIVQILQLISSNTNWAYATRGNVNLIAFSMCYILIPLMIVLLMIVILYQYRVAKKEISSVQVAILLILGISFLLNLPRGIVRHSLVENVQMFIMSTATLFISLCCYVMLKKFKLQGFIICETCLILFSSLLLSPSVFPTSTLINNLINPLNNVSSNYVRNASGETRVVVSDSMKKIYEPLKNLMDTLLDKNETYIDFTNQTLLYSLLDRYKPVYINQSPGLLSGEFSQQQFIKEIENSTCGVELVLMPIKDVPFSFGLDGINNSYRYYLVSEYISNNYVPICKNNEFALWCKKEDFEEKNKKVKKIVKDNEMKVDALEFEKMNYLDISKHQYELVDIPYVWANFDKINYQQKKGKPLIKERNVKLSPGEIFEKEIKLANVDKSKGNYLLIELDALEKGNMQIVLGNKNFEVQTQCIFNFRTQDIGKALYLVRISSDFLWYSNQIEAIRIKSDVNVVLNNIYLIRGDVLSTNKIGQ